MEENSDSNDINVGSIGNSIEKDIKIINNFITYFNKNIQNGNKADLTVLGEEINAIEHILSDYKRVLKENEYMHNELNKQQTTINKYAKENEELKNKIMEKELEIIGKEEYTKASMGEIIEQYYTANEDCITKQRIEAKIEELDIAISECIYLDDDDKAYKKAVKKDKLCLLNQKRALQELLGKE